MSEDLNKAFIRWGDWIVERFTKISPNRLTMKAITGILALAGIFVFGMPALRLKHEGDKDYWDLLIDYNQSDPWAFRVAIIAIISIVIIFIINRLADKNVDSAKTINKIKSKGDGNTFIQNSPNSRI